MQLSELKTKLLSRFGVTPEGVTPLSDPQAIRLQQISKISVCVAGVLLGGLYMFSSKGSESVKDSNQDSKGSTSQFGAVDNKPKEKSALDMATPLTPLDEKQIWVSLMEKRANEMSNENGRMKDENKFLIKRLDVLEDFVESMKPHAMRKTGSGNQGLSADGTGKGTDDLSSIQSQNQPNLSPSSAYSSQGQPQHYPPMGAEMYGAPGGHPSVNLGGPGGSPKPLRKPGPKIAFLGGGRMGGGGFKNTALYMPAGSHSKAVIMSGVAASTATAAQGNPQPVLLRLVDEGNLPRGFKSRVKDAVLTGACYGDISSERVLCRLETMSWVEKDGSIAEKKVEGWIFGEDGRAGLRGEVVDRAGEVLRESFVAGLLSAASNFVKLEATSSVYPVSPFGVTNALSGKDVAQGAVASGAGNAFDKLAEFSIKRAEQMQPIIMVSAGRVVDVVFKAGVDLSTDSSGEMKVVGSNTNSQNANDSVEG